MFPGHNVYVPTIEIVSEPESESATGTEWWARVVDTSPVIRLQVAQLSRWADCTVGQRLASKLVERIDTLWAVSESFTTG